MNSNIKITTIQNKEQLPIIESESKIEENDSKYNIKYIQEKILTEIIYIKEENKVIISKKGIGSNIYNSELVFEEKIINKATIITADYVIEFEIKTKSIKLEKEENKIIIVLEYDINDAHNNVKVEIFC